MDIFRFTNPRHPLRMEQGRFIGRVKSAMWVERYRDPGEFKIVAEASTGIRSALPLGSYISHTDTKNIMIVEDHEINDDGVSDPIVTVTGRSFEVFLEDKVVGSNRSYPTTDPVPNQQTVATVGPISTAGWFITQHTYSSKVSDQRNAVPYFELVYMTDPAAPGGDTRLVKFGPVYDRAIEILKEEDVGIAIVRPGPNSPAIDDLNTAMILHKGVDRSASVVFSYSAGEIESADYLWSRKKNKNCAIITGKWVDTIIDTAKTGVDRQMMHVDGTSIDEHMQVYPTSVYAAELKAEMAILGRQALADQKMVNLIKAEVTKEAQRWIFRQDYEVGDFVTVQGNYNTTTKMRVTEHVETIDENGTHSYPTLALPEEN